MRWFVLPALLALAAPAGAQWTLEAGPVAGPNARAAQAPAGPNARAAQRPVGPNGAILRARLPRDETRHATCGEVAAVRGTPISRGEPGYSRHLDRNGNGRACERD